MNRRLLWIAVVALLIIGFIAYRSLRPRDNLNVEPHAREVIEKAKRR